jgi:hypothetical protein
VGASSGDLRHALKACRAAIDELEQQHQQQQQQQETAVTTALLDSCSGAATAAAVAPAVLSVGPQQMSIALGRLAGVRSAQFGAQAASIIRSLPNQQQMLLYSLAVFCQQPTENAAAGGQHPVTPSKGGKAAASSLWKGAGSAAVLSSGAPGGGSPAGAPGSWSGLKKKKKAVTGSGSQAGAQASVFALAVTADAAYHQYMQVGCLHGLGGGLLLCAACRVTCPASCLNEDGSMMAWCALGVCLPMRCSAARHKPIR